MGFIRQCYLLQVLNEDEHCTFPTAAEMNEVAYLVGKNIALINDLYGLEAEVSGEPNSPC